MKIGIDCRSILHPQAGESAGVGHYVHHLVDAILREDVRNQYVLFFDNHDVAQAKREFLVGRPNVTARVLPFRVLRRTMPFVYRHMVVANVFERERLDLLHGPANVVPLFYRRPWTVTVHDLAIYDRPEWFRPEALGTQGFSKSVLVPHSVEHARRVIAVSQCTARDVSRLFDVPAQRIDVIPEGVTVASPPADADALITARGLSRGRYFLFVGTVEPRKNIASAVRAFATAARDGRLPADAVFVIAGGRGWKNGYEFEVIRHANAELGGERVRYLGYVSADEKAALMSGATAFVYPSHFEGFGLPPLEAMSLGTPVIASDTPALVETCGDAALLSPATHEVTLAENMVRLWHGPALRERLAAAGRARASGFTWQKAARATVASYEAAGQTVVSLDGHDAA